MCPVALGEVYTFPITVVRMPFSGIHNEKMNAVIYVGPIPATVLIHLIFGYSLGT